MHFRPSEIAGWIEARMEDLAPGRRAQVHFDCKRATLDPDGVHLIALLVLDLIDELVTGDARRIDAIGGSTIGADRVVGHVAGLSWERSVASRLVSHRPLKAFLVRKASKEHGTGRVIENDIPKGARVPRSRSTATVPCTARASSGCSLLGLDRSGRPSVSFRRHLLADPYHSSVAQW